MKKLVILVVVGLFLAMGVTQAVAKNHGIPNLAGAKFVGTGTFADATSGQFFDDVAVEMDVTAQQGKLFLGNFIVTIQGTPVSVPFAGEVDHKEVTIAGAGFSIEGEFLQMRQNATQLFLQVIQTGTTFPRVGLGTFVLVKQ